MTVDDLKAIIVPITEKLAGQPVNKDMARMLNAEFPADGPVVKTLRQTCDAAIEAGWMCDRGDDDRRFGRVIKPGPETHDFSVDVVSLNSAAGPHHSHPSGEICLVMPVDDTAKFDGMGAGWCVYPPKSAHVPTVTDGRALVLYMLPNGEINFTK